MAINAGAVLVSQANLTGDMLVELNTTSPQEAVTRLDSLAGFARNAATGSSITALNTVGAATLTAAAITGGVITRGGAQVAAFTDTTDTAAALIAARTNSQVGSSYRLVYKNDSAFPATIAGGAGVTVSGISVVGGNSWAEFLVTQASASTVTIVGIETGSNVSLPPSKFTTGAAATFPAGALTGAEIVNYTNTGSNAALTTRTAAQMFADIPNCQVGYSYQLNIRNENATGATVTAADGTVTLTGTMTIAQNVTRSFVVTFTAANAVTIQSMGISAAGA